MKNRSLVLGICAIVFATGSAFTTVNTGSAVSAWVRVKVAGNPNFQCISTNVACTNTGEFPCVIDVTRDVPAPPQAFPTRGRTEDCAVLTHNISDAGDYNPTTITITEVSPL